MSITAGSIPAGRLPGFPRTRARTQTPARARARARARRDPGVRIRLHGHNRIAWGRVAALLTIVALSALLGAGVRAATASGPAPLDDGAAVVRADRTALAEHVVQPGDTIWALAQALDPSADPRPMVDRIIRLNGLAGAEVEVGRVLLVPSRP